MNDSSIIITPDRLNPNGADTVKKVRQLFPLGQIISFGGSPHINIVRFSHREEVNAGHDLDLALRLLSRTNIVLISGRAVRIGNPRQSTIFVTKRKQDKIGVIEQAHKAISFSFDSQNEWTGSAVLMGSEVKLLKSLDLQDCYKMFLFEILNKVIFKGGVFNVQYVKGKSYDEDQYE